MKDIFIGLIGGILTIVVAVLLTNACQGENRAGMPKNSRIRLSDKDGNEYIVRHEVGEVYRVELLPR